ncbi:dienelactone hydrolase family protein [Telmatospirillum sp.]|uniref:dienelactone hydrolase family protein n=1 Tax=Telmatospirillum sp. TaxID=2079197 RepID=UPI002851EE7C|nr:dienelactone hydrolase family protein [Telmatospirillum sp.]MDR3439352.1 dienelactone hydrolase family protein [Telmatospirillum sp.]
MGTTIDLASTDGISAYVAEPEDAPQGTIVVVQEIFGVNSHIRSVADHYAKEGFIAIAPALFDRVEKDVDLDYSPESVEKGMEIVRQIGFELALTDVAAAIAWAEKRTPGRVAVVGFCFGGTLAWLAATRLRPAAVVAYYGGHIAQFLSEPPQVPVMVHFGERDAHIPREVSEAIKQRYPDVSVHLYPADHGFNCDVRASFDPLSAALAKERTLEFLRSHLVLRSAGRKG